MRSSGDIAVLERVPATAEVMTLTITDRSKKVLKVGSESAMLAAV